MSVMNTATFRSSTLPVLRKIFADNDAALPREYDKVFSTEQGMKRSVHMEVLEYGFDAMGEKAQGGNYVYDSGGERFTASYIYAEYGKAYALTLALMEDGEMSPTLKRFTRDLARAARQTQELTAADVLNNAFSATIVGGDGVSLVNTAHPMIGFTQSNRIAVEAALSEASLEQLLIQMMTYRDARGLNTAMQALRLILPPQLVFQAQRILASTLRQGTANNDVNAMKLMGSIPEIAKMTRLTNPASYFLQTDVPEGLKYIERRKLTLSSEGDFESDNMRYKGSMRFAVGFTDPFGVFGAQGI
jgi:hypothetical protein